ncbi:MULTISPECIES: glycosyltransferase [unclassified Curtobacterium]|uniref:glycosyltransferase n=1 Tax=unclassified Curtobacterium TaxID=257496 RepID=UPI00226B8798|nr:MULTISPECIES: glycosyltransferase [unclassified Curtobacterium]
MRSALPVVPDVDIVLVHFHSDRALLARCLTSIDRAATAAGLRVHLVIVDNGGTVPVELVPSSIHCRVVDAGGNVGFGRAVNRGVREATARWVLVLNPDAALADDALAGFVSAGEQHRTALMVGLMSRAGEVEIDAYVDWDFSVERLRKRARWALDPAASGPVPVEKVSGGALFADTALLRLLGPFDERFFMYCEDADLSRRAHAAGIPTLLVPTARIEHARSASEASFHPVVEAARADGAIRVTTLHRARRVALLQRAELLAVTLLGLVPGRLDRAGRTARRARLRSVARWGLRRDVERFAPDPG